MDKQNFAFVELCGTCERLARELSQDGVGAKVRHATIIIPEEDQLWDSSAIGTFFPQRF